ncbi:cytochrome P450 [Desarmillaria tabescens]|uniref:Cytochrome P450 n=1 Tax=Armillaria tabescens TaxID=1929756 RepID=A0AA39J923_ARMTA|nr:cytochrome P450 [Desarmillaria tabescens]KAK0437954.1 cytochrome P450 [Desarmillaria tabescens]
MHWTSSTILIVNTALFLAGVVIVRNLYNRRLGLPYPPGPTPSIIPFVGNLHDMPTKAGWFEFTEWGKLYGIGRLLCSRSWVKKICIINMIRTATDLLDARSAVYSDRPQMRMVRELTNFYGMGWEFNVGFQNYGPKHKKRNNVAPRETPMMSGAIRRTSARNDEFVRIAEEAQFAMVSAARPGLILLIPSPRAREGRKLAEDLQNKPYAWARKQFDEGKAKPSFFTSIMETKGLCSGDPVEKEQLIKKASALMYATDADTILASVLNFFLAMLHAPDCIVKETLRWEQGTALVLLDRIVYEGYFIPKGTTMIPNQYAMASLEPLSDPMVYRPERFMEAPTAKDGGPRDPNTIAFGWGQRICPGRFLAENSLWPHAATTLACFNISPIIGSDGRFVIPPRDYTSGPASPKPFSCHIRPRNPGVAELIKDNIASVESQ